MEGRYKWSWMQGVEGRKGGSYGGKRGDEGRNGEGGRLQMAILVY